MYKFKATILLVAMCVFTLSNALSCVEQDCSTVQCEELKCKDDQRIYKHLCSCCEACFDTLADGEPCQVTPFREMGEKDCRPNSKCVGECKPSDEYFCKGICVKNE